MKAAVCIKQVPANDVGMDEETGRLRRSDGEKILNPFDFGAISAALSLKDRLKAEGKYLNISVFSMGPASAEMVLREALSLGADEAYLLSDTSFGGSDVLATSQVLCAALDKAGPFDLLFFGNRTTDGDTGQVGPETAAMLSIPYIAGTDSIEVENDRKVYFKRTLSGCVQMGCVYLPCAFIINSESFPARVSSLKQKMSAGKKKIIIWGQEDLDLKKTGAKASATVVKRIYPSPRLCKGEAFTKTENEFVAFLEKEITFRALR